MRPADPAIPPGLARVLFLSAFLIATCGLVYELVAGALASYLLGNSITQFSLVIGAYLSAMGVGSWLSRFVERDLLARFVEVELAVALIGGFEAMVLFAAFAWSSSFRFVLFAEVGMIGMLVGLELPLLLRILKENTELKELLARVLFLDYIGALMASLAFPLLLVPRLGLFRTSLLFGLLNAGVALWATFLFVTPTPRLKRLRGVAVAVVVILLLAFPVAGTVELKVESGLFADPVVFRQVTPYQRVVVTHRGQDTRLFLDGALQFSSVDEYRYHEALVHPAMVAHAAPKRVLVLGGGDGLGAREVLRHASVEVVTLVDLDPQVTTLFSEREELAALNDHALLDERVEVVNADAFVWLQEQRDAEPWDVVLIDFPDPNDYAVGKLYTTQFYRLVRRVMAPGATLAVQSTSAFFSPQAFWCIVRTLEHEGFSVAPYHAYVPSFGEWGFAMASLQPVVRFRPLPGDLRFLDDDSLPPLFDFPRDMERREGPVNRLSNQVLVRIYEEDWARLWD